MKYFYSKKSGSVIVIIVFVVSIILLGAVGFYFLLKKDVESESFESSITNLIKNNSGEVIDSSLVSITHREGIYANGLVKNYSGQNKYFYLVYTNGVWQLVDYGEAVSCERLSALGFSKGGISGCVIAYNESLSAADALALSNSSSTEVTVIGLVDFVDPNLGTFSISSGGKKIEAISSNIQNVDVGDTVVVAGIIDNSVITATEITDLVEEKKTASSGSSKNKDKNYKEPESAPEEVKYMYLLDVNQADIVKLRNDPSI